MLVLNSFIKTGLSQNLLTTNQILLVDKLLNHISMGIHLVIISCKTTSSKAIRPISPKIAFAEQ